MNSEGIFEGLSDPKLIYMARRVSNIGRLAGYRAIARADTPSRMPAPVKGSIEAIALARFRSQPELKQKRGIEKANAFMALPTAARTRRFGELASIDLNNAKSVEELAKSVPIPAAMRINAAYMKKVAADPKLFISGFQQPVDDGGFTPQFDYDNLRLRIRKVKCNDETDGFAGSEAGDDEIRLAGLGIDETGDVHKIAAFTVGDSFDDGESKVFNPPKNFASFNLKEGSQWPKTYYVSLVLAEVDNGGLPSYMNDLYDYAKERVKALIDEGGVAALGPELGKVISAIAVAVFQALLDFFTSIWEDDLFPVVTPYANIGSLNHVFASGGRTSSEKSKWVAAHGGKYTMYFDWQVYE